MNRSLLIAALLIGASVCSAEEVEYGVDVSFPMHHRNVSRNYAWLPHNLDPSLETPDEFKGVPIQMLGNRQKAYIDTIQGCVDFYGKQGFRCIQTEKGRVEMSLRQPKGMFNYTEKGYTKIRAPENVFKLIKEFWEANKDKQHPENWPVGNTYTNHWSSPTYMTSIDNISLEGAGPVLKQHVWNAARDTISEWTGQQLAECSLYGIRIYKEGSVLATHVDRLPLVSSAIINVDQDVDEPWPLEVIGHDGKAVNITMLPGDLVLYESHSILHGRPFPLKGRFMANIFIHFEPIGPVGSDININPDLPSYVVPGSEEEANWRKRNPNGYKIQQFNSFATGSTEAHRAAIENKPELLRSLLLKKSELSNARDVNGWTPMHEAVRSGHTEIVKILIEHGSDVNARTGAEGKNSGPSALWWALQKHDEDHEVVKLLLENGAKKFASGSRTEL